jgi:DUF438 domain-containing protein
MIDQMNEHIVKAIFETLPVEITIIDANDEVIGWNKNETRLFKRPLSSMGLNFRHCHPEASLLKVIQIVDEMRAGNRDQAQFWVDMKVGPGEEKHKIFIEFFALRDTDGSYLGCMECVQDVEAMRHVEGEKRLLD